MAGTGAVASPLGRRGRARRVDGRAQSLKEALATPGAPLVSWVVMPGGQGCAIRSTDCSASGA